MPQSNTQEPEQERRGHVSRINPLAVSLGRVVEVSTKNECDVAAHRNVCRELHPAVSTVCAIVRGERASCAHSSADRESVGGIIHKFDAGRAGHRGLLAFDNGSRIANVPCNANDLLKRAAYLHSA